MARLDKRLFAPFAIEMDENPKIFPLSDAAFRALFEAVFYSRRMLSDGFLDERVVVKRWSKEVADELSSNDPARPSWIRVDGGWQIHDFERHNPLRAEIEAITDAKRSNGVKGGVASGKARNATQAEPNSSATESEANGKQTGNKTNPETETETETPIAPKREHTLPDGWKPNSNCVTFAESNRLDASFQAEQFKARALADGKKFKDWDAAFRYWLGNAVKWRKPGEGSAPASKAMTVAELVAHRERVMNDAR